MKNEVLLFSRDGLTAEQVIDCKIFIYSIRAICSRPWDYRDYLSYIDDCIGDETFFGVDLCGDIIMSYHSAHMFSVDESQEILDFAEWVMS